MDSVSHVEKNKNELSKEVHRLAQLGVFLLDKDGVGVVFQNGLESYLVVEVKQK